MPTMPQRDDADLPQRQVSLAEMFGVPSQATTTAQHPLPAAAPSRSMLHTALAWLWRSFIHGCAAHAFGMYPGFIDPDDLANMLPPRHRAPARTAPRTAPVPPPQRSPWEFASELLPDADDAGKETRRYAMSGNRLG